MPGYGVGGAQHPGQRGGARIHHDELSEAVIREHPAIVAEHWAKGAVMNRIGSIGEVAGAVIYLVGDEASFTTGEVLTVDSGLKLR